MSADADVTEVDDVDALLEELAVDMNGGLADAMVIFGLTSNGGRWLRVDAAGGRW